MEETVVIGSAYAYISLGIVIAFLIMLVYYVIKLVRSNKH